MQLLPIETSRIRADTQRCSDLDELMTLMHEEDERYRYSVAWIDCLARGGGLGRSVLIRGDHAPADAGGAGSGRSNGALAVPGGTRLAAPPWTPPGLLRRSTVRIFNEAYYRAAPAHETGRLEPIPKFLPAITMSCGCTRSVQRGRRS